MPGVTRVDGAPDRGHAAGGKEARADAQAGCGRSGSGAGGAAEAERRGGFW